jgi:S1-C subfamily serine protease
VQTRKAFDFDLSGMYVTAGGRDLRTYEIRYVTPGSAADQAGFIIGDVITQVHRTQARRMTLQELRDMLSVPDDYLVLVVRRGAETLKLAIRLRPVV